MRGSNEPLGDEQGEIIAGREKEKTESFKLFVF